MAIKEKAGIKAFRSNRRQDCVAKPTIYIIWWAFYRVGEMENSSTTIRLPPIYTQVNPSLAFVMNHYSVKCLDEYADAEWIELPTPYVKQASIAGIANSDIFL